jgi:hypothetical protein
LTSESLASQFRLSRLQEPECKRHYAIPTTAAPKLSKGKHTRTLGFKRPWYHYIGPPYYIDTRFRPCKATTRTASSENNDTTNLYHPTGAGLGQCTPDCMVRVLIGSAYGLLSSAVHLTSRPLVPPYSPPPHYPQTSSCLTRIRGFRLPILQIDDIIKHVSSIAALQKVRDDSCLPLAVGRDA